MSTGRRPVLYAIVCGAGPASEVGRLVDEAQDRGWDVWVIATPAALDFVDVPTLEERSRHPLRSAYQPSGEPRHRSLPHADAIIVAPATYNTINKWAVGVSDTFALGVLAEAPGLGIATVALPFVNTALASSPAFRRSITVLREQGVRLIHGQGEWEAHTPGTGDKLIADFPWRRALDEAERLLTETSGQHKDRRGQ
ncbi:MAG: flavoprotein [Streptosporangiaceae bacterium]